MGKLKSSQQRRSLAANGGWAMNNDPLTMGSASALSAWTDQVQFSDNIKGWRDKLKLGENVSTSMVGVRGFVRGTGSGVIYQTTGAISNNYRTEASGDLLLGYLENPLAMQNVPSSVLEQARSLAEIEFAKRFNRHTTQFESGVFAGELLQTVRLLVSPAKALRSSVDVLHKDLKTLYKNVRANEFRNGRTQTLKALRDGTAGIWLEWSFGVKPLISDCDDAARAFRALASGRTFENVRFTGNGFAESAIQVSPFPFSPGTPGFLSDGAYAANVFYKHTAEVTLRGAWKTDRVDGQMPIPRIFGLTWGDILPTAWELIPWSFLADYFVNIGDVLNAWSLRTVKFNWVNETVRLHTVKYVQPPPHYYNKGGSSPITNNSKFDGTMQIHRYIINRHPYSQRWAASPVVKIPGIDSNTNKWLNIAALLAMRLPPAR